MRHIYIHKSIPFKTVNNDSSDEYQQVDIYLNKYVLSVVNFYNPCSRLFECKLQTLLQQCNKKIFLCGDFNSHNTLWGSILTDKNGEIVEDFLVNNELMILNDGSPTRLNPHSGNMSCLDLSFVSKEIGIRCMWYATKETHGSDHFVININIKVGKNIEQSSKSEDNDRGITWSFMNANWKVYNDNLCSVFCQHKVPPTNVQEQYDFFIQNVLDVTNDMFRIKPNESHKCRPTPWWNLECKQVVKERNKAKKYIFEVNDVYRLTEL